MNVPYQMIRSDRKTIAIQIKPDGEIVVRCPKRMRIEDARRFVESKADWIQLQLSKLPAQDTVKYTAREIEQLREQARSMIVAQVKYYALHSLGYLRRLFEFRRIFAELTPMQRNLSML